MKLIKKIISYKTNNPNSLYITYKPFKICNYHCPYCYENGTYRTQINKENINLFFKNFDNMIESFLLTHKEIDISEFKTKLSLIGGETSLVDWRKYLDKITHKTFKSFVLITNFSNTLQYYIDLYEYCKKRNILCGILYTYHPSQTTFEEYSNKLTLLNDYLIKSGCKNKQSVRCVITKENIEEIYRIEKFIDKLDFIKFEPSVDHFAVDFKQNLHSTNKDLYLWIEEIFKNKDNSKHRKIEIIFNDDTSVKNIHMRNIIIDYGKEYFKTLETKKINCVFNKRKFKIDEDGEIKFDCDNVNYKSGNIFKNKFNFSSDIDIANTVYCDQCRKINCLSGQILSFE